MKKLTSLPQAFAAVALFTLTGGVAAIGALSESPKSTPTDKPLAPAADSNPVASADDPAVALRKSIRTKLVGLVADSALEIPAANLPEGADRDKLAQTLDDAMRRTNDIPILIRGSLELLTRFEPADDFSNRLWRAAVAIDYWQRSTGSDHMTRLLDGMIDLCALFPREDQANYQGEFLRASVLGRRKNLDAAGKILTELRDRAGLPEEFHMMVIAGLGDNAASRRDYDSAVSNWEMLEDFSESPMAVQPLLAAVFAHLERGKREDAYRVLGMLRRIKADVIKASPVGFQVNELLALSRDRAESDAFWDGQAQWWPAWMDVDRKLGPAPAADYIEIPLIPNIQQLGSMIGRAAQQNDTAERARGLRRLAHAGRWEPAMLVEMTELLVSLNPLQLGAVAGEYRAFVISVYEHGNLKDPFRRRPLCCMAASAFIDSQQNDKAQAALREFATLPQADDNFTHIASRLTAIAALNTGKGLEEAATSGENALESSAYEVYRWQGVLLLSHLYERLGRDKEAIALIDKEIKGPAIQKDANGVRTLTARRAAIEGKNAPKGNLSAAVKTWLGQIRLPWLDFSRPHALTDAGIGDFDQALTLGISALTPCEQTKLAALLAQDDSQPEKRQLSALWIIGFYSSAFAPDSATAGRWARSFLDLENVPPGAKEAFFAGCALRAFAEDDAVLFQELATHPTRKMLSPQADSVIEQSEAYFAACKAGNEDCARLGESVLGKPFTGPSRDIFQHVVSRLTSAGDFAGAKRLIDALGSMPQALDPDNGKAATQLALIKALSHQQKWKPVNDAIRDLVLARFGKDAPEPAPFVSNSDYRLLSINFSEAEATKVRLQAIRTGRFTAQSDYFWIQFMRDIPRTPENLALRLASLRAALEVAPDDATRSDVVRIITSILDVDSAEERGAAEEILKPYRKADEKSKVADALRSYDFSIALRIGASMDVRAALGTIKEDQSKRAANATALNHAVGAGDEALMRYLIDSVSPQELMSDRLIAVTLPAYRMLGMKDEATLAEQSAREAAYRLVIEYWTGGNDGPIVNAYQTAEVLGDESLIPRAMTDALIASRHIELTRLTIDGEDAVFRREWDRALKVCEQALRNYPSYYHFYYLQGQALAALNRTDDALRSLRSYVSVVHDEAEVHGAKDLINKLSGAPAKEGEPAK